MQIVIHDVMSFQKETKETRTVCGRERDADKALVVSGFNDIVCVREPISTSYLQMLASLGIGPHPKNIMVAAEKTRSPRCEATLAKAIIQNPSMIDRIRKGIENHPEVIINPYVVSREVIELAALLETQGGKRVLVAGGTPEIFFTASHKHLMKKQAMLMEIPVADGETVLLNANSEKSSLGFNNIRDAISRQLKKNGRVIIKSSFGILRSTLIQVDSGEHSIGRALQVLEQFGHIRSYLVEKLYDVRVSPNILMFVQPRGGSISCVGITDQRLDKNLAHQGNIFPSTAKTLAKMIDDARRFSQWLQSIGYYGIVGFDFCEYQEDSSGKLSYFLSEINPRVNASFYPLALMSTLNRMQTRRGLPNLEAFISAKQVAVKACDFHEFRTKFSRFMFRPGATRGIFPYSVAYLNKGMLDFVAFGRSLNEAERLYNSFLDALEEWLIAD